MSETEEQRFPRTAAEAPRDPVARAEAAAHRLEEVLRTFGPPAPPRREEWRPDRPGGTTSEYRLQVVDRAIGIGLTLVIAVLVYLEKPVDWEMLVVLAGVVFGNSVAANAYSRGRAIVKAAKLRGRGGPDDDGR